MVEIDAETGKPRPVLIDWGLVKEFDDRERLAFSRTVRAHRSRCAHDLSSQITSVANVDVMGLMEAFQDMGFTFKRPQSKVKGRKVVADEASPIPVDPELYMDAISIMLTNKVIAHISPPATHTKTSINYPTHTYAYIRTKVVKIKNNDIQSYINAGRRERH